MANKKRVTRRKAGGATATAGQPPVQGGDVTVWRPGERVPGYADRAGAFTGLVVAERSFVFRATVAGSCVVVTEAFLRDLVEETGWRAVR